MLETLYQHIFYNVNVEFNDYFNQLTKNIRYNLNTDKDAPRPYPNRRVILTPVALENPNKRINLYLDERYRISANDIEQDATLLPSLTSVGVAEPDSFDIKIVVIKRGITFVFDYFKVLDVPDQNRLSMSMQQSAAHKIRIYKHEGSVIVVTNEWNEKLERKTLCLIKIFGESTLTFSENLSRFFQTLGTGNSKELIDQWQRLTHTKEIRNKLRMEKLQGLIDAATTYVVKGYATQKQRFKENIATLERQLEDSWREYNKYAALQSFYTPTTSTNDLADYIANNPYVIDFYGKNEQTLVLAIEAPIEYLDQKLLRNYLNNPASFVYPKWGANANIPPSILKNSDLFVQFMQDVFTGERYKLYSRAEVAFDLQTNTAYPVKKTSDVSDLRNYPKSWSVSERIKDPERCITSHMHIEYFDCWSGNKSMITKALAKNDLIGAIDILVNTVKDLNLSDSTVFGRFLSDAFYAYKPDTHTERNFPKPVVSGRQADRFKTILDTESNTFRTMWDIFKNDYLKSSIQQEDLDEDFSEFII